MAVAFAVVTAAKTVARAVQSHAEAFAGFWGTGESQEVTTVDLDRLYQDHWLEKMAAGEVPPGGELVLESDLAGTSTEA